MNFCFVSYVFVVAYIMAGYPARRSSEPRAAQYRPRPVPRYTETHTGRTSANSRRSQKRTLLLLRPATCHCADAAPAVRLYE